MLRTVKFQGENKGWTYVQADTTTPSEAARAVRDLWLGIAFKFSRGVILATGDVEHTYSKGFDRRKIVVISR